MNSLVESCEVTPLCDHIYIIPIVNASLANTHLNTPCWQYRGVRSSKLLESLSQSADRQILDQARKYVSEAVWRGQGIDHKDPCPREPPFSHARYETMIEKLPPPLVSQISSSRFRPSVPRAYVPLVLGMFFFFFNQRRWWWEMRPRTQHEIRRRYRS